MILFFLYTELSYDTLSLAIYVVYFAFSKYHFYNPVLSEIKQLQNVETKGDLQVKNKLRRNYSDQVRLFVTMKYIHTQYFRQDLHGFREIPTPNSFCFLRNLFYSVALCLH